MDIPFGLEGWLFWLLLTIGLLIIEIFTPGFFFACLGLGALLAVVPALFDLDFAWQLALFSVGSLGSILFLRPIINKPRGQHYATGVEALIGREIRLSDPIPQDGYAEVRIDGDVWRVSLRDKGEAPKGTLIRIVGYEGIVLQARITEEV